MAKQKKKRFDPTKTILIGVILVLVVACAVLSVALYRANNNYSSSGIHINLSGMQYSIQNGQAVRRNDTAINNFQTFLTKSAKKDIQLGCTSSYYDVMAFTQNQTQVLLSYGCEYPDARIFAVKDNGQWKFLSPTNEFDTFLTPECDYVDQNNISTDIAPVCVNTLYSPNPASNYVVR